MDPENIEKMKETKREIENKVGKILKLIRNDGQAEKGKIPEDSKKSELIGHVEDLHKQYQSLYAQYDHLRAEMGKIGHSRKEKNNSCSSFGSDSEYYSSDEMDRFHETSEGSKEEPETPNFGVTGVENRFPSSTVENEALHSKYTAALSKLKEADERNRELSALVKMHELHGTQASEQVKDLEGQLIMMKSDLDSLRKLKKDVEAQIDNKETEAKQLQETNILLHSRVSELELLSEEKRDEISTIRKQMKDNETKLNSRIEELMEEVNDLRLEAISLRAQKGKLETSKRKEASAQAKGLKNRINVMQKELDSLRSKKSTLEEQLDMKTKEVKENLLRIETLEGEIAKKAIIGQELQKEKEGFLVQRENLELEASSLRDQKNRLEELIRSKNQGMDQLREEKERLHARMLELEGIVTDKGDALSICLKEHEGKENEASAQIMALKSQVNLLQEDMDSLRSGKRILEMQNQRLKLDSEERQIQAENEIHNLTIKIEDQQKTLKERDETIKKLTEEPKVAKQRSLDSPKFRSIDFPRLNPQSAERKMDELAENFNKTMENHIRILYQRILVAEQIHAETKDSYKTIKAGLEEEKRELDEKRASFEAGVKKIRDLLSEQGENARNLDKDNIGNLVDRISGILNELGLSKNSIVGRNDEITKLKQEVDRLTTQLSGKEGANDEITRLKQEVERLTMQLSRKEGGNDETTKLKQEVDRLTEQLSSKEEKELTLREKVWKLEAKLSKEGGEKLNAISHLEMKLISLEQQQKEKDEFLAGLGEEKREAIRQLCILIDYHRSRYDQLKAAISKKNGRSINTPA